MERSLIDCWDDSVQASSSCLLLHCLPVSCGIFQPA